MGLEFYNLDITRKIQYTHDTQRIWVKFQNIENVEFVPGQFITFDLPISENKRERLRSYSIAAAYSTKNEFELLVREYKNGRGGSEYLCTKTVVGDVLQGRKPLGGLVLPGNINNNSKFYFICTGTGVAPFRTMINHIIDNNIPFESIDLIFGTKEIKDEFYKAEWMNLELKNAKFKYHSVFSRYGEKQGYVSEIYTKMNIIPNVNTYIYLCGWRNMIDEAKNYFKDLGHISPQIFLELYG